MVVVVAVVEAERLGSEECTVNEVAEAVPVLLSSVIVFGWKSFGHKRSSAYPIETIRPEVYSKGL